MTAEAKIARAEVHLAALADAVCAWEDAAEYEGNLHYSLDEQRIDLTVRFHARPPVEEWALVAGDVLNNLRSALDHAVYDLAVRQTGQDPPEGSRQLQFPIVSTEAAWRDASKRLGPLSGQAREAIHGLQPATAPGSSLGLLRDLNNQDKHRLLNVVVFSVDLGALEFAGLVPGSQTTVVWRDTPIDLDQESAVMTVTFDRPQGKPDLALSLGWRVSFAIHGGAGGKVLTVHDPETGEVLAPAFELGQPGPTPSLVDALASVRDGVRAAVAVLAGIDPGKAKRAARPA